jgi:hypothetical protein
MGGALKSLLLAFKKRAFRFVEGALTGLAPFAIIRAARARRRGKRERLGVVFVASQVGIREIKVAQALRAAGWKVHLLYQWRHPSSRPLTDYFDSAQRFLAPFHALWLASAHTPMAYHVFSSSSDPVAETLIRHKPGPVVYDAKDVLEWSSFAEVEKSQVRDMRHRIKGQVFCIRNADALCCRDLQVPRLARHYGFRRPRSVYFPEYCFDKTYPERQYWKPGDEIHTVCAGYFGLESLGHREHRYLDFSRLLTSQGIHVHIYAWVGLPADVTFEQAYADYLELERSTPYFHLHRRVPLEQLREEMLGYHIGLLNFFSLSCGEKALFPGHSLGGGSTRVFDYLEAGMPTLANRGAYAYAMMARYGLAIDGRIDLLRNAQQELGAFLSQDVEGRVKRAREAYNPRKHVGRLTRLYNEMGSAGPSW